MKDKKKCINVTSDGMMFPVNAKISIYKKKKENSRGQLWLIIF